MLQVKTSELEEYIRTCSPDAKLWIYNAYDVMLPQEIFDEVDKRMNTNHRATYRLEKAMQSVAFSMMQNGIKVDMLLLMRELKRAKNEQDELENYVRSLAIVAWGDGINILSHTQMCDLFYLDPQGFQCSKQFEGTGAKRHLSCSRKSLEKVHDSNYYTQPLIRAIWALKDIGKEIEFLERGVEPDGRVHCSFNVAATETGRWSSSKNPWGRGANFQNQGEKTRSIYLSDEGYVFGYPDLSQAESRAVAYYSGDKNYLRAVEGEDIHTEVAKLIWPELHWVGTPKGDREVADEPYYRHFSYRDMSKRGGHALNYIGSHWTIAKNLNLSEEQAEDFYTRYHAAFPGVRLWHDSVQRNLQAGGTLITALKRERMFFGRLDDNETLKEAIAYLPQSLISDIMKIGTLYAWREFELNRRWVKMCGDMHDGTLMLIKSIHLDECAPEIIKLMEIPIQMPFGVMTIPVDFKVGYRWQKDKMRYWKPGILSELEIPTPTTNLLDVPATEV